MHKNFRKQLYVPDERVPNLAGSYTMDLLVPNKRVFDVQGQYRQYLMGKENQIYKDLTNILQSTDSCAVCANTYGDTIAALLFIFNIIGVVILGFIMGIRNIKFLIIGGGSTFIVVTLVFVWKRIARLLGEKFQEPALDNIVDYVQNLKIKYPELNQVNGYVVWPVEVGDNIGHCGWRSYGRQIFSRWCIVKLTYGMIKPPVDGPIYWPEGVVINEEVKPTISTVPNQQVGLPMSQQPIQVILQNGQQLPDFSAPIPSNMQIQYYPNNNFNMPNNRGYNNVGTVNHMNMNINNMNNMNNLNNINNPNTMINMSHVQQNFTPHEGVNGNITYS